MSNLAQLEVKWRRVASTHTLKDLIEADAPVQPVVQQWKLVAAGAALCAFAMLFGAGAVFVVAVTLLSPGAAAQRVASLPAPAYYALLLPLTLPVTLLAVTANWFCLKLFKHNS